MRMRHRLLALSLTLLVGGCNTPIPLLPIPVFPMAPDTALLKEQEEASPMVDVALKGGSSGAVRSFRLAMRGGRTVAVKERASMNQLLEGLPSAAMKTDLMNFYVPPPVLFSSPKGGDWHYYNFRVTPEFAQANTYYLHGETSAALAEIEKIFALAQAQPTSENADPLLLWQASKLKVLTEILMGRTDLAEQETRRTEELEVKTMKINVSARALRAEARFWGGDQERAAQDAVQVIKELGEWRFPTAYSTPPVDQAKLAATTTAQVWANMVLGWVLMNKGMHKEALPWLELANQTMNNVMFVNRHPLYGLYFPAYQDILYGRGMALTALGTALVMNEPDSPRAEEMFTHALEYFDRMGFRVGRTMVHTYRAQALAVAGRHKEALVQADKGLALAEQFELLDYVWRLEVIRGKSYFALNNREEAEKALRHAQSVVDLMVGTMTSDDAKVRFGAGKEQITELLARIDMAKDDPALLFEDLERGRARAFVALLANRAVAASGHEELVKELRAMDQAILKERQKKNALTTTNGGSKEMVLLNQRQQLVQKLHAVAPDLADVFQVSATSLKDVQRAMKPGEAMIYTITLTDKEPLHQLVITSHSARIEPLALSVVELGNILKEFYATLQQEEGAVSERSLARSGKREPVPVKSLPLERIGEGLRIKQWKEYQRVYVVPSGPVHFIPWGGLAITAPVAVLPTGGWVERIKPMKTRSIQEAVVVGDPEFGKTVGQLPGARAEAEALAKLYNATPLIGQEATEASLRRTVGAGTDVLHLATHALYDAVYPLKSALLLTDGKTAAPLTAERLYEKPLASRLVVLSACETGMGKAIAGDDLLGLTRSFYLGGTQSVISTLWPVSDTATRQFMEIFHQEARNLDLGQAWLKARDSLRSSGFKPFEYAPFILNGSFGVRSSASSAL